MTIRLRGMDIHHYNFGNKKQTRYFELKILLTSNFIVVWDDNKVKSLYAAKHHEKNQKVSFFLFLEQF